MSLLLFLREGLGYGYLQQVTIIVENEKSGEGQHYQGVGTVKYLLYDNGENTVSRGSAVTSTIQLSGWEFLTPWLVLQKTRLPYTKALKFNHIKLATSITTQSSITDISKKTSRQRTFFHSRSQKFQIHKKLTERKYNDYTLQITSKTNTTKCVS